ncbi:MAG TPA: hypothetical protein VGP13_03340 [Candidatus Paceibacterota bacterium]|jgi:hypothetical protein|nr:hypothetical protein [Candidatus Paceibacterota bacterium]
MLRFIIAVDALRIPAARLGNYLLRERGYPLGVFEIVSIEKYNRTTKKPEASTNAEMLSMYAVERGAARGGADIYIGIAAGMDTVMCGMDLNPEVRYEIGVAIDRHGVPYPSELLNGGQIGEQVRNGSVSVGARDHSRELFYNVALWIDELLAPDPR